MSSKTMATYWVVVEFRGPDDVVMPTAPVSAGALDDWLETMGVDINDDAVAHIAVSRLDRPAMTCGDVVAPGEADPRD